jgi:hypothetical protein
LDTLAIEFELVLISSRGTVLDRVAEPAAATNLTLRQYVLGNS